MLASPYREITKPVLDYVRALRRKSPRDVVTVYIPEYVVGHWWEQLLHNQSALRLKGRLLFTPGVMVTSVPFQLRSSAVAERRLERPDRGRRQRPAWAGRLAAQAGRAARTVPLEEDSTPPSGTVTDPTDGCRDPAAATDQGGGAHCGGGQGPGRRHADLANDVS